jgi:hypothetical protein
MVAAGILALMTEWQRRQTIKTLITGATAGSIVTARDTAEGYSIGVSAVNGLRQPNLRS